MAIRETLIPALQLEFPERGLRVSLPPDPVATFPAACSEVGDLCIYDAGEEATVFIRNVTHVHINPHDQTLSAEERGMWITKEVVNFLHDFFADRVLLWSIENGTRGGGLKIPFEGTIPDGIRPGADVFVWSRKLGVAR